MFKRLNWRVRINNPAFWITTIPMALAIITLILDIFGVTVDLGDLGNKLKALVQLVFMFLGALGLVNDPTTKGFSDSTQAMTYEKPKE